MISFFLRGGILVLALTILVTLLPASQGLPPEVYSAISYFIDVARGFDWLFPINSLFTALKAFIYFELSVFLFVFLRWLFHMISDLISRTGLL